MNPRSLMNTFVPQPYIAAMAALICCLVAGCATSKSSSFAARPGAGLREYRQLVTDLRKATVASQQSVEQLAAVSQVKSNAAFGQFDESLHSLEVASIKARARADAMERRGRAYFDEWTEEIAEVQDAAARKVATGQFDNLQLHFESILADSRQVRQEFRKFLDGLRALRGSNPGGLDRIAADGLKAERAMDKLLSTLQSALAVVESGASRSPKTGGKP